MLILVDIGPINGTSTTLEVCMCPKTKRVKKVENLTCGDLLEIVRAKYSQYLDMHIGKQIDVAQKLKSISDELQEARTRSSTNKQGKLVQLQAGTLLQKTMQKQTA